MRRHRQTRGKGQTGSYYPQREREREKHYRQIILISACVCALRARFSGIKSISTTNLEHSSNRGECTLHIYSIDGALVIV